MRRREFLIGLGGAAASQRLLPPAWAQQSARSYRIAYLALLPAENVSFAQPLLQRLQELGYREGQNIVWDYRSAEGRSDRLPQLASELLEAGPDVLIAGFGTLASKAALAATRSTPIVFTAVGDPVGAGLVNSLREPGGNATGMSALAADLVAKRLQLLNDLVPGKKLVAVLVNSDTPYTAIALEQVKAAAAVMELPFVVFDARTGNEAPRAIDRAIEAGAASMLVLEDPVLLGALPSIVDRLAKVRLPAMFGPRECAVAGGLIAYGTDQNQLSRRAADMVDKILRGAKPASLPVEQPTKFELVINLRTARDLGLVISPTTLARADELIE